jgi:protein-S-isoprenylcysteine O-methyltransferase Ste14
MSKAMSILVSVLFFVAAPVVVAGLVPWWIMRWEFQPAFLGFEVTRVIGVMLIIAGIPGLVDSFARFALQGLGTPAPIAPTQNLVVTGLYRYVRNPIYIALVSVTVGQALLFGDGRLLWYGAVVWLAFHLFVVLYEEPTLQLKFGMEYETFRANVPRWIPRLTPWRAAIATNQVPPPPGPTIADLEEELTRRARAKAKADYNQKAKELKASGKPQPRDAYGRLRKW